MRFLETVNDHTLEPNLEHTRKSHILSNICTIWQNHVKRCNTLTYYKLHLCHLQIRYLATKMIHIIQCKNLFSNASQTQVWKQDHYYYKLPEQMHEKALQFWCPKCINNNLLIFNFLLPVLRVCVYIYIYIETRLHANIKEITETRIWFTQNRIEIIKQT